GVDRRAGRGRAAAGLRPRREGASDVDRAQPALVPAPPAPPPERPAPAPARELARADPRRGGGRGDQLDRRARGAPVREAGADPRRAGGPAAGGVSRRRDEFYDEAARHTPYVAAESDGLVFLVPTGDRKAARFFTKGTRKELRVLEKALAALGAAGVEMPGST